tara:strand:+ start:11732 stop:12295 length:564 start_codon:yes stop_codon:yes gene_type:complete
MIRVKYKDINNEVYVRPVQRTANNTVDVIDRAKNTYLIYFRSDMSERVCYTYATKINDYGAKRSTYEYTSLQFNQVDTVAEQDLYKFRVNLQPPGYWYYIIYEVNFKEGIDIQYEGTTFNLLKPGYCPIDNIGTFDEWQEVGPEPYDGINGELGIAVEEGKMYVDEDPNAITYTEHTQNNNNYIYTE